MKTYGAFVDLGGVTGLLHVSQISHERITNVDKILQEGDKLKVGAATQLLPAESQPAMPTLFAYAPGRVMPGAQVARTPHVLAPGITWQITPLPLPMSCRHGAEPPLTLLKRSPPLRR